MVKRARRAGEWSLQCSEVLLVRDRCKVHRTTCPEPGDAGDAFVATDVAEVHEWDVGRPANKLQAEGKIDVEAVRLERPAHLLARDA